GRCQGPQDARQHSFPRVLRGPVLAALAERRILFGSIDLDLAYHPIQILHRERIVVDAQITADFGNAGAVVGDAGRADGQAFENRQAEPFEERWVDGRLGAHQQLVLFELRHEAGELYAAGLDRLAEPFRYRLVLGKPTHLADEDETMSFQHVAEQQ